MKYMKVASIFIQHYCTAALSAMDSSERAVHPPTTILIACMLFESSWLLHTMHLQKPRSNAKTNIHGMINSILIISFVASDIGQIQYSKRFEVGKKSSRSCYQYRTVVANMCALCMHWAVCLSPTCVDRRTAMVCNRLSEGQNVAIS